MAWKYFAIVNTLDFDGIKQIFLQNIYAMNTIIFSLISRKCKRTCLYEIKFVYLLVGVYIK